MKTNLPYLNQERLTIIFERVYNVASERKTENGFKEERLSDLLKVLQAMQSFNLHHRPDDTRELYGLMSAVFYLDPNTEGTTYRLALILAIKELYGFSDDKLVSVMKQVQIK